MKTIIALTNFSESSFNAVNYAADMAKALQADLVLMHVVQMPVSFEVPLTEYEFNAMQQDAQDELAKIKADLVKRTRGAVNISTKAIAGTMLHEIEEVCESKKPFLVVLGTERRNWTERFVFGSNTFNSVKNLHYPVLVVPQSAVFKPISRIALASDCNDIGNAPLEILRELVNIFHASVDIIHVNAGKDDEAKSAVSFQIVKHRFDEFNPRTFFINGDNIEEAINNYAEQHNDDLVMVIARKHNFFQSLVHKSQSSHITLKPHIPVLAVAE
jgi:nucleotide-binding universal stress UspA family protein